MEPVQEEIIQNLQEKPQKKENPMFPFMGIGSLIYAAFYTFCLYKNSSGITYPFFVSGTCLFFFLYLKKSGHTAKKFSIFLVICLVLIGLSTCLTDSYIIIAFNKTGIFFLFFYMLLHNLYEDRHWDIPKYLGSIINILFTSLLFIFDPFTNFYAFCKTRKKIKNQSDGKGKYIFFGILIALPLLFVILLLLLEADAVFSNAFNHIFSFNIIFDFEDDIWGMIFLFIFIFFVSYCIISRISVHNLKEEVPDKKTAEPLIGITFTGLISFVYLIFCYIQVIYLFGGLGTLPEGYTYASYARAGFFQLVFVCLINLTLVLICMKRFRKNKVLKGILTFISLCTYIMIASSTYRMLLYIQTYYLTFLRIFVLWTLFVITLFMTGALVMIYRETFPFTRYCVVTVTLLYLAFSFARPDYWIARYNLNHIYLTEKETEEYHNRYGYNDFYYLNHLSNDAAPVIFGNAENLGYGNEDWFIRYATNIQKKNIKYNLGKNSSIRKWNFSRWTAYHFYTNYADSHKDFHPNF